VRAADTDHPGRISNHTIHHSHGTIGAKRRANSTGQIVDGGNSMKMFSLTNAHSPLFTPPNSTAGFAGDDAPRSVFPSLIGRARQPGIMVSSPCRF
jgi:hypothetical protein